MVPAMAAVQRQLLKTDAARCEKTEGAIKNPPGARPQLLRYAVPGGLFRLQSVFFRALKVLKGLGDELELSLIHI